MFYDTIYIFLRAQVYAVTGLWVVYAARRARAMTLIMLSNKKSIGIIVYRIPTAPSLPRMSTEVQRCQATIVETSTV